MNILLCGGFLLLFDRKCFYPSYWLLEGRSILFATLIEIFLSSLSLICLYIDRDEVRAVFLVQFLRKGMMAWL